MGLPIKSRAPTEIADGDTIRDSSVDNSKLITSDWSIKFLTAAYIHRLPIYNLLRFGRKEISFVCFIMNQNKNYKIFSEQKRRYL